MLLICISLITSKAEHILICYWLLRFPFFKLMSFVYFFLFFFPLFSVLCSSVSSSHSPFCNFQKLFCSLDCSPFLGTWIANVLSSSRLSSCHIYGDFWWTEVLNCSIVKHPSFLLQSLLFVTCLKNPSVPQENIIF